ncbi:MAG: hypothetical protein HON77_05425 [Gammaproteobacteria bacterium]|nr:hypothetical protein [Gammaproteobacteria bacterium]MBT6583730.1 hypothetical protein [Gammaproteobacteria bacterium]MBT6890653.1 hypothetical protein [Gammaproteobacteria bacterium]
MNSAIDYYPMSRLHKTRVVHSSVSSVALIAANLAPVGGVLFFAWTIEDVLLLYWAESAVIGIYNLARMWVIGRWKILLLGPFFLVHYSGFMAGHLFFIYALVISSSDVSVSASGILDHLLLLSPALIALLISHGVSFFFNFLGEKEYETTSLSEQLNAPYRRIVVMHITIMLGSLLVMAMDNKLLFVVSMMALKVGLDLRAHLGEHDLEGQKEPV